MVEVESLLSDPVVVARDLTVFYGAEAALEDLSFSIDQGRVLAVVGANGAGKSTLFRALLGFIPSERGTARLFGRAPHALTNDDRSKIAYVSERHSELGHARVSELAKFRASIYPRFDSSLFETLLTELDLPRGGVIGELSRGQRAGVVVSLAIAQRPDLLLLDDPTLGLDPLARRRIIQAVLAATRERPLTVLIATHELADVERIADDVVLLARGRGAVAVEMESFVSDACVLGVLQRVDGASLAAIEGVLHVWQKRDGHEVVVRGDASERELTRSRVAELVGREISSRPVGFEELALAWLARRGAS